MLRRILKPVGDRTGVTERFDTTTRVAPVGAVLDVVAPDVEAGWQGCRDLAGRLGWFPINRLAPL